MLTMPAPDAAVIARRADIVSELRGFLAPEQVVATPLSLRAYESDALTAYRQPPLVVVLPETVDEVSRVLRYAYRSEVESQRRYVAVMTWGPAA